MKKLDRLRTFTRDTFKPALSHALQYASRSEHQDDQAKQGCSLAGCVIEPQIHISRKLVPSHPDIKAIVQ